MDLEAELSGIERELWKNDAVLYEHHLDERALLVFPETGVITRAIAVEAILRENAEGRRWAEVQFSEVRVLPVTADTALLTYVATSRWEHEADTTEALASSLYVRRNGPWKLVFHQQTPV